MQRQVTVYEASKNGKVTVLENVEATTLGELKSIMVAKGIDVENMDFMEGVSNTTLRDDSSVLPEHIRYKETYTDNLFIYLSLKNKKIASGMDRREIYKLIAEMDLGGKIKAAFGKNYTQVSSAELERFIDDSEEPVPPQEVAYENPEVSDSEKLEALQKAFIELVEVLCKGGCLYSVRKNEILEMLKVKKEPVVSIFNADIADFVTKLTNSQ